jgi:CMP-N,N'-diacetyllegionaminic acid synthase
VIRGRRVCALIPARGGSKGIRRKNLYNLCGVSLIEHAIQLARSNTAIDVVYVSTDDPDAYAIASSHGAATPRPRPAELASDGARTIDVLKNLVAEGVMRADDCVLLLQPTTPLRTRAHLASVYALLDSKWEDADAVVSVSLIDGPHPYKAQIIRDGLLHSLVAHDASVPRQSLPRAYLPNGAFYFGKSDVLLAQQTFMPDRTLPFEMDAVSSINLDTPLDLLLLETVVEQGLAKPGA